MGRCLGAGVDGSARSYPLTARRSTQQSHLPPLRTPADARAALAAIVRATAAGEVSPDDGRALAVLVSAWRVSASAAGLPPPGDYADDLDLSVLSEDELRATAAALEKAERAARRRCDGDGDDGDGSDGRLN